LLHEIPDDLAHAIVAQLADERRLHAHPTERDERVEDRSAGQGRVRLSVAEEDELQSVESEKGVDFGRDFDILNRLFVQ